MDKDITKLFARLSALKGNIPERGWGVPEKYVSEFNSILEELQNNSGEDLDDFKIPDNEVRPRVTSVNMGGKKTYSSERFCDKEFISMKIDGVLSYFTLLLQPKEIQNKMGFSVEERD